MVGGLGLRVCGPGLLIRALVIARSLVVWTLLSSYDSHIIRIIWFGVARIPLLLLAFGFSALGLEKGCAFWVLGDP